MKPPWTNLNNYDFTKLLYLPTDGIIFEHNNFFQNDSNVKYDIHKFEQDKLNYRNTVFTDNNSRIILQNKKELEIKKLQTKLIKKETELENINFRLSAINVETAANNSKNDEQQKFNENLANLNKQKKTINDRIKVLKAKINKKIDRQEQILRCRLYEMKFHKRQHKMFFEWINECVYIYNFCVDRYKLEKFSLEYKTSKIMIFNEFYGSNIRDSFRDKYVKMLNDYEINKKTNHELVFTIDNEFKILTSDEIKKRLIDKKLKSENSNSKPIPYDILTDVVKSFCANTKSAISNLKNKNIKHFTLHHKKLDNFSSFVVPPRFITKKIKKGVIVELGLFLGHTADYVKSKTIMNKIFKFNIKKFNKNIDVESIESDCRLKYNKKTNKFYLCVPTHINLGNPSFKENYCALDPGEKIFQAFYGEKTCGTIGDMIRTKIINIHNTIRKLLRILSKKKNKTGKKLKNRKHLIRRIRSHYNKIAGIVKKLHNQTALFLCRNYERILIP